MLTICPAGPADVDAILALRDDATAWLAGRGIDQWARPWPDERSQRLRIAASCAAGETWMVRRRGGEVIATVAVDTDGDPRLWAAAELQEPARYLHRMIVARAAAGVGLGALLIDWIAAAAALDGARWLRVDVWTTNLALHTYYRAHGFADVRVADDETYPSGALFQRPVSPA